MASIFRWYSELFINSTKKIMSFRQHLQQQHHHFVSNEYYYNNIFIFFSSLERWVIYLCSTKLLYRTHKKIMPLSSPWWLESQHFSPLTSSKLLFYWLHFSVCTYFFFVWIFHEGRRQKIKLFSSIFYLPHGSRMKIYVWIYTAEERR